MGELDIKLPVHPTLDGGQIRRPRPIGETNNEIIERGHDLRAMPTPQLTGILKQRHIAAIVEAVFDPHSARTSSIKRCAEATVGDKLVMP